jgi:DNA-binding transcriptional regulator GbsR (MarR family)
VTDAGEKETPAARQPDPEAMTFVERFAAEMVEAGMQRMPARVFSVLMVSDEGVLNSAEVAEQLHVSPAAVSGAVRYLSQVGMITREREPGTRRERYRVHYDQWYEALGRRDKILLRWERTLRDGISAVGPDTTAGQRLEEMAEFFAFMQGELLAMLDRWQERKRELSGQDAV